jgi:hypothetical protein
MSLGNFRPHLHLPSFLRLGIVLLKVAPPGRFFTEGSLFINPGSWVSEDCVGDEGRVSSPAAHACGQDLDFFLPFLPDFVFSAGFALFALSLSRLSFWASLTAPFLTALMIFWASGSFRESHS